MAKRRIAEQDYERLLNVNITSSTMTVKQLRKYVSLATKQFNENIGRYKGATRTSADYLLENIGSYRGKLIQKTDRLTKRELISRANLLRSHFRIDSDSLLIETELSEKSKKAYESMKKALGEDETFTEEIYKELVKAYGSLGEAVLEKLDSYQLASIYVEARYFSKEEAYTLYDIVRQVYDDMLHDDKYKGLEKSAFSVKLTDLVKERLAGMY